MSSLIFQRDDVFDYGRVQRLSSRLRRLVAPNPGPLTYHGTNSFILGQGTVALLDPGPCLKVHEQDLDKALQGETVSHIFLTHHHGDHAPLAFVLARKYGAKIYGYPLPDPQCSVGDGQEGGDGFCPDVNIGDGARFEGAGWTLEAVHTPGHTSNHLCYELLEENTLFSGDHIMGWSTSVVSPPDGDMGAYLNSLKKIKKRHYALLWPGHGPSVSEPGAFIDALIDHRLRREAQILKAVKQGKKSVTQLVEDIYQDLDPRLKKAASLSVLAHLKYLEQQGYVQQSLGTPPLFTAIT